MIWKTFLETMLLGPLYRRFILQNHHRSKGRRLPLGAALRKGYSLKIRLISPQIRDAGALVRRPSRRLSASDTVDLKWAVATGLGLPVE